MCRRPVYDMLCTALTRSIWVSVRRMRKPQTNPRPAITPAKRAAIRAGLLRYSSNRTYSVRVYCSPEPSSFSLKRSVSR